MIKLVRRFGCCDEKTSNTPPGFKKVVISARFQIRSLHETDLSIPGITLSSDPESLPCLGKKVNSSPRTELFIGRPPEDLTQEGLLKGVCGQKGLIHFNALLGLFSGMQKDCSTYKAITTIGWQKMLAEIGRAERGVKTITFWELFLSPYKSDAPIDLDDMVILTST